jgi:creatinine amidohydrolase
MLHLAPEFVRPLSEAGPGTARPHRLTGIREGWAWAPRRWTQVTEDTGVGNPAKSSAEKGAKYVSAAIAKIADFLVELHALDLEKLYQD